MDKETYEALNLIMHNIKHYASEKCSSEHLIYNAIKQVENWTNEVEKEYEEKD